MSLAQKVDRASILEGLHEADSTFVFAAFFRSSPGSHLWLCRNNREAEKIVRNLTFFLPQDQAEPVLNIPGVEADPYRGLSPHPEVAAKRALGLWKLLRGHRGFTVTTVTSLATRTPAPADFLNHCIPLEVGNFLPLDHLLERLWEIGYVREDPVSEAGEFANRGGIVDIFSPNHGYPVRIEFFGDEIESIRQFDAGTQRSTQLISTCEVVPIRETILTEQDIARWQEEAPKHWNHVRFAETLTEKLQFTENRELFNGFEYTFPLVTDNDHSMLEFFPPGQELRIVVPHPSELLEQLGQLHSRMEAKFEDQHAAGELVLPPERLFFQTEWMRDQLKEDRRNEGRVFYLEEVPERAEFGESFDFQPERKYRGRIQEILSDLNKWLDANERAVFVMATRGMAERLVDIFGEYGVGVHFSEGSIEDALSHPLSVLSGKLSESFYSAGLGLHVLTQENLFEQSQPKPTPLKAGGQGAGGRFLSNFRDLQQGDYLVHMDHGIGLFAGLKRIGVQDEIREFVELVYRDDDKVYVPVDRLDLVQKYSSVGGAKPRMDRLGGVSWEKTKSRVKKSMRQLAQDLLKLYARREVAQGHAFSPDDFMSREFEEAFEYEETPDQLAAIQDVRRDMESDRPMDRLICGDVGYGKTEVAMRATFKVVKESKQVGLLAPTTVLAFQHYRTFKDRLRGFPVHIEMISRLQSRQNQKDILGRTSMGLVDLLIGTHRLLSKDVKFRDLGLIIVDEEQRFGVAQKERLKKLKTKVGVLALSATPIPRTLNMSLIGLRDLSFIETPPKDRLAIQTVVVKFSRNIIRSAIDLELKREGQVLFVHNSIETIHSVARMVQEVVPDARVAFAHGQMRERELEKVMIDFMSYQHDVLVSTTIIENGLDIPRANTLIVNRADRFGLAQLYQLRGRVGRSSRRAYAYFLISSEETLSGPARKRLAAIKEFSDLGAGFRLAALDLEIRGAGNLLGSEQHGHINAIGFELYMKLLEETIRQLKGEATAPDVQTSVDLRLNIQVPEHYISDSNLRLWLYKRIASAPDEASLGNLREEVVDRFGRYPNSVANLFECARLRLRAQELRILSVERKGKRVFFRFREDTPVSPQHIVELVGGNMHLSLNPTGILSAEISSTTAPEIFDRLHALLEEIAVLE